MTHNFLEASHGKGPADGIGAAVKNKADQLVAFGKDVLDIHQLFSSVQKTVNVTLYEISSEEISAVVELTKDVDLKPVPGTMKIHQLMTSRDLQGTFFHREISCFCNSRPTSVDYGEFCSCHSSEKFKVDGRKKQNVVNTVASKIETNLTIEMVTNLKSVLLKGMMWSLKI